MLQDEGLLRLGIFASAIILLAMLEGRHHWRAHARTIKRLSANAGLLVIGTMILRLLVPITAVALALRIEDEWGLMHWLAIPNWLAIITGLLLLDMVIYWQHRVMHTVPWLWRLHRVHHSDRHLDLTTALRFHPIELMLSMAIKLAVIALLGAPAVAVIMFEILLSTCALFSHANLHLPAALETRLRRILITPALHRIHHSTNPVETNSNYGFSVVWWDTLFGSFTAQAAQGDNIDIGLKEYTNEDALHLIALLKQPLENLDA